MFPRLLLPAEVLAVLFCFGCQQEPKGTPEQQALLERYNQVQDDMTEDEVDAVFEGYRAYKRAQVQWVTSSQGIKLPRPSKFIKRYIKGSNEEGNDFAEVYFDDAGYVIGKDRGGIMK
jgi:hypothetical protein